MPKFFGLGLWTWNHLAFETPARTLWSIPDQFCARIIMLTGEVQAKLRLRNLSHDLSKNGVELRTVCH